jgi:phosphatidylserine decarboxylase
VRFRVVLIVQLLLIIGSIFAVGEWAVNFPYPSPLIKPVLSPKLRWPTEQVINWIETQDVDPSFKKFFYRDPERKIPAGSNLVAAADGKVQVIDYRDGYTFLVIGLSFWDVHVVRTPIAGTVESIESEGTYFPRFPTKEERDAEFFLRGKAAPVQQIVTLRTTIGEVKVRLVTSYWASRIKVWSFPGEQLKKGQRIGRMLLGSTVVVELPGRHVLGIHVGQHVTGGDTIIANQEMDK